MSLSLLSAPQPLDGSHKIYVEINSAVSDEACLSISRDARIAGFLVRDKASRDRLLSYEREILDLAAFSGQQASYMLENGAVLVDRAVLRGEGSESAEQTCRLIDYLVADKKYVFIIGELLFSLCFKSIPTRAEVSDVFHLCRSGVAGFVISAEIARRDSLAEGIAQLAEVLGVFESEWKK